MTPETRRYVLGESNATRDDFILSREKLGDAECVYIALAENPADRLYTLWTKRHKQRKADPETGEITQPKHIGGKRPYIMLMQDQQDILYNLSFQAAGLLIKLIGGGFVDWGTGRLIDRRSKKPLTINNVAQRFNISTKLLKPLIKELTAANVINYDHHQRAYILNGKIARKGGSK